VRRNIGWLLVAASALSALCLELQMQWGGVGVANPIDDFSELAAAIAATVAAGFRARRSIDRWRWSWGLIAAGAGCWAVGQGIWSYYELVAHQATPFPSLADAGYLLFPVLALIGLLLRPAVSFARHGRLRIMLDGILAAASLFVLTWVTTLGAVLHAGASSRFDLAVSLAYPVGDLLLLTVTLVVVTNAQAHARLGLVLLATGFAALSVADSGFAYLTTAGSYGTGNVIDAGWVAGFAILAVAALKDRPSAANGSRAPVSNLALMLPYGPALLGLVLTVYRVRGHHSDNVSLAAAAVIMLVLLIRQFLVLHDNRGLVTVITRQALYDNLTGLANRSLFADRLEHALDLHRRDMRELAILFIDLDDFKLVNDGLGHAMGDRLLVHVAERLRGALRPGDTFARLGGDEFAVLLEDGGEPVTVAQRLCDALRAPFVINGQEILSRASIGVASVPSDTQTPTGADIMSNADIAMYRAKRLGKNDLCLYLPGMGHNDVTDFAMSVALAAAVAEGRIGVAYQPIVNLATGELHAFEALARWQHEGQDVPPVVFIPIAERLGLMSTLTDHMLVTACAQVADWSALPGGETVRISVNVPSALLGDWDFPKRVSAAIARFGMLPQQLALEITETALIADPERAKQLCHRLTAAGALLSLDDFGSGYSSLAHLQSIPLHSLKIDKTFIERIGQDGPADVLIAAIITLSHQLGLQVIAEGIESDRQLEVLTKLGCELGQGFIFARPLTSQSAAQLLASSHLPRFAAASS
jgi:diguanylate cyclase (GGDEF)-like protein